MLESTPRLSVHKRYFDIIFSVLGLLLVSPVLAVIAAALWLESPGHVFFSQARLGRGGRRFNLYKFRKFPTHWKDSGPGVTVAGDARMTKIGAFLERTKLDELPQFWNILRGDMSFVGPRPESERYAHLFEGEFAHVLDYIPGIFGPNQVAMRNESELYPPDVPPDQFYCEVLFPMKAREDLAYFSQATLFSDCLWIVRGAAITILGVINWKRFMSLHAPMLVIDTLAIEATWTIVHLLFYSGLPTGVELKLFVTGMWLLPPFIVAGMLAGGCYRHPIRHFCLADSTRLVFAASLLWILSIALLAFLSGHALPLGAGVLGLPLVLALMLAPRALRRLFWERSWGRAQMSGSSRPILIYGSGRGGTALTAFLAQACSGLHIVGFLDDDPSLRGMFVGRIPVLGRESDLPTIHHVHNLAEVWLTFRPAINKLERLRQTSKDLGIRLVIVPDQEPFVRYSRAYGDEGPSTDKVS